MALSKQTKYQIAGVLLTGIAYGSIHFGRSAWPYSKHELDWMEEEFKGWIDFSFLLAYSFGIIFAGYLGDKLNIRYFYVFGLFGTCCCYTVIGLIGIYDIRNQWFLLVTFIFNGLFQSIGWPCCISVIGNWIQRSNRGTVLGFWCINVNIGNMMGSLIGGLIIDKLKWNWGYLMLIVASIEFVVCFLLLGLLQPYPEKVGIVIDEYGDTPITTAEAEEDTSYEITDPLITEDVNSFDDTEGDFELSKDNIVVMKKQEPLGIWSALLIPGVIGAGFSFAFLKTASYGELFWLPSYLKNEFNMEGEVAFIAQMVEVGNIIGNVVCGYLTDKTKARALFIPILMWTVAIDFYIMSFFDESDYYLWLVGMIIEGFFIGGSYMLISAALASDLGKTEGLKNNKKAISTVAGIIDGFGSFMTALGMLVFPLFEGKLFLLFAASSFLSGTFMIGLAYQDLKNILANKKAHKSENPKQIKEKITDIVKKDISEIEEIEEEETLQI